MGLKDQIQADADNAVMNTNDLARTSAYTPVSTGESGNVPIIWNILNSGVEMEDSGQVKQRRAELELSASDVTLPRRGDIAAYPVDGAEFFVMGIIRSDGFTHLVDAVENIRITHGNITKEV